MKFILLLLLSLNIYALEKVELNEQSLSSQQPKILLDSITKYSIRIGTGKINTYYIFVDPMCPHSKNLIEMISKDRMKQVQTTYYIFLYRLPKFESDDLIHYIYQSNNMKEALLNVMVKNSEIDLDDFAVDDSKSKMIEEIAIIGKKLKMKKRPYTIVFDKESRCCRVSEGSAPCLEEFDFQ